MLALKKKREEAKAAAEAAAKDADADTPTDDSGVGTHSPANNKVSLLGVGGKKQTKNGDSKATKKRSPGEIRIQKGTREQQDQVVFIQLWIFWGLICNDNVLTPRNARVYRHRRAGWWKCSHY
jgi:hypothetical protein